MWLTINLNSETAIYTQIRNQIIEGIIAGSIKENDSLPSVRQLAADLGVNLHTVNKAYNLLKQEGFITIHRQKGAVINPAENYRADQDYLVKLSKELRPVIAESLCRGMTRTDFIEAIDIIYNEFKSLKKEAKNNG